MPESTTHDDIVECKHLADWIEDLAGRICGKLNQFSLIEDDSITVKVRSRMLRGRGQADCLRTIASELRINLGLADEQYEKNED